MGSVKLETRNEGRGLREWDYLPLGEDRVVAYLIKNRSKLDPALYPSLTASDLYSTSGVFLFSEPIICTYVDLENLIHTCGLSPMEMYTVNHMMLGYTLADMADQFGKTRQSFDVYFKRAVQKDLQKEQ